MKQTGARSCRVFKAMRKASLVFILICPLNLESGRHAAHQPSQVLCTLHTLTPPNVAQAISLPEMLTPHPPFPFISYSSVRLGWKSASPGKPFMGLELGKLAGQHSHHSLESNCSSEAPFALTWRHLTSYPPFRSSECYRLPAASHPH